MPAPTSPLEAKEAPEAPDSGNLEASDFGEIGGRRLIVAGERGVGHRLA
jgi:hypothetical protein